MNQEKRELRSRLYHFKEDLIYKATDSELYLKNLLDSLGLKYRFQKAVLIDNRFRVLDFYFPHTKIAIEVDGEYHFTPEQILRDEYRYREIKSKRRKLKIIRIKNEQIKKDWVIDILKEIKKIQENKLR